MIHGVDLSVWNVVRSYPELARSCAFAYVKATDARRAGAGWLAYDDPKHEAHSLALRAAGVPTGSYCFGHPNQDVAQSASYFVQKAWFDQLRPVIDMESLNADNTIPGHAGDWTEAWCQRVEAATGVKVIVYSSTSYAMAMMGQCRALRDRDWWIAAYPGDSVHPPERMPVVPGLNQARVLAWQWTGSATLPGVDGHVDRDVAPSIEPLYVSAPAL